MNSTGTEMWNTAEGKILQSQAARVGVQNGMRGYSNNKQSLSPQNKQPRRENEGK